MANAFNLTAQLQLQAPTNTAQVANQISKQLNGIKVDVQVKANPQQMAKANAQMQGLSKSTQQSANNMGNLNRSLSEAARRFSVITIATGSMLALARSIKNAFGGAIEFERELIKIEQVTSKSVKQLSGLTKEITRLSTSLGASSKDLLGISRILTQAGFEINKVGKALDILAKTTLGATFENIEDTTEGAVAVLRQFGEEARKTGGDIKFLQQTMDAINSVSKSFAVESGDLITVIRRTGGVFEAAGGSVNELIALFTSVRSTTRETAETIATGLRTIFTRLQRTDTVDKLRDLGIELRNSKGEFVGAYEAVNRLSVGLSSLDPKDFRFSEIVESLGGFRQIGKVIPLIKQFTVAQDALRVAQTSGGSVAKDAQTAQQSLAVQFERTKEKFEALVRGLADSSSFQTMARGVLKLADAFIKIVDALEPLLPMLLPLLGLKLGKALAPGLGALSGASRFAQGRNQGGPIKKFATGGMVPGTGNRDTVDAMLTPGEFVIRKGSVKKIGMDKLQQMNAKGYASGGKITRTVSALDKKFPSIPRNRAPFKNIQPSDTATANIKLKSIDQIPPKTSTTILKELSSKNTKVSADAFEKIAAKKVKGTLLNPDQSPIDIATARTLIEAKFRPLGVVSSGDILGKLFRDSLGKEAGSTKRRAASLRNYKTTRGGENSDFGSIGLAFPKDKASLIKEARSILRQRNNKKKQQKFAAGGAVQSILGQNKVGAVNLDVGKDNDVKLGASLAQVNATQTVQKNNFLKNNAGVRKYLKSKGKSAVPSYTLKRKSLDETTGNKFRTAVVDELVKGVDGASGRLGQDLIGQPVKASDQAKSGLKNKFIGEGGVIGDIYESVLNVAANKGNFAPSSLFQPFDFPNGLHPPLVDNFSGVPSAFVDARKGQTSKDKGSFEKKIANQIALEAAASPFGKASTKTQKAALGGMIKRFARGGSAGGDTVPAMLTPGEFVFNKDAAQKIGGAKLDAMNKRGEVQGFAKGGAVQYLGSGGRPTGGSLGLSGATANPNAFGGVIDSLTNVSGAFQSIGVTAEKFLAIQSLVEKALKDGNTEAQAFNIGMEELVRSSKEAKRATESQVAAQQALIDNPTSGSTVSSDENLSSAQNLLPSQNPASATPAVIAAAGESEAVRQQLEDAQKAEILAITREIRQRDKNVGLQEAKRRAEQVVTNAYGVLARDIEVRKTLGQKLLAKTKGLLKATAARAKQLFTKQGFGSNAQEGLDGVKAASAKQQSKIAGVGKVQGIAQSAQQFVFLAAGATALVSQFTGMEEATKKAITQTSAFAATAVGGVGTILDLAASVYLTIAAKKAETLAALEAAAALRLLAAQAGPQALAKFDADQLPTKKVGGGLTKLLGPLAAAAAAIAAIALVMTYWRNKATAEAEELAKANDGYIEKIGKGQDFKAALQTGVNRQIGKGAEAESYSLTGGAGLAGMATGGLAATAASFALIGAVGGPLGIALGAVTGAAIGLGVAMYMASDAQVAAREKREQEIQILNDVIGSYSDLLSAQHAFKTALSDIDLADGLTSEQRVSRRLGAQENFKADSSQTEGDAKARKLLLDLAKGEGKAVSELTEKDFKENSIESQNFKFATKQMSESLNAASLGTSEARKTLSEASKGAIGGGNQTFEGVTTGDTDFAKAYQNVKSAIVEEFKLKKASNQLELASVRDKMRTATGDDREKYVAQETALIQQGIEARKRAIQQTKDLKTGIDNQIESSNKAHDAQLQLAAAAEEAAQRLSTILDFGNDLANLGKTIDDFGRNVSDMSSVSGGGIQDFSFAEVLGLKDLKRTGNAKEFSRDLDSLVRDLPAGMQKQGLAMVNSVKTTASLLQKGQVAVSKLQFAPTEGKIGVSETERLIKASGLDASKIPKNMFAEIQRKLQDSFKSGIDAKEFADIFGPFIEEGQNAAKELEKINGLRNKELAHYKSYVENMLAVRDKEVQDRADAYEVNKLADDIRRRARGKDQSQGSIVRERLIESRNRLSGTGAKAGNLDSILGTRRRASALLQQSIQRQNAGGLSISGKKQETKNQLELQKIIKVTTDELGHFKSTVNELADEQIKLIEAQRERSKAEKEATKGIIEEAVVGGPEQRFNLAKTLFNVTKAFRSGTLQNQSPEDRSSTVAMLDRFEDVFLPGAGMTGGQLKDLLIQQDAMRMGLPPEVVQALYSEDDVQKTLIKSTDRLAFIMTKIADGMLEGPMMDRAIQQGLDPQTARAMFGGGRRKQFGGAIYRNEGGSIFQPKGTDTVPAMLTPGEFVVRKSAVDKVGVGTLDAINQGKPLYRMGGGSVPGDRSSGGYSRQYDDRYQKGKSKKALSGNSTNEEVFKLLVQQHGFEQAVDMVMRGNPNESVIKMINKAKAKNFYDSKKSSVEKGLKIDDISEYKEGRSKKRGVSGADEVALRYFNNLHENILSGNTVFPYSPEDPFRADYTDLGVGKIKESYLKALTRTSIEFPSYSKEIQEKYQAAFEKAKSYGMKSGNITLDPTDHWLSSFSFDKDTFAEIRTNFDPSKVETDDGVAFAMKSRAIQQQKARQIADENAKGKAERERQAATEQEKRVKKNKYAEKQKANYSGDAGKYDGTTEVVNGRNFIKGTKALGGMYSDYSVTKTNAESRASDKKIEEDRRIEEGLASLPPIMPPSDKVEKYERQRDAEINAYRNRKRNADALASEQEVEEKRRQAALQSQREMPDGSYSVARSKVNASHKKLGYEVEDGSDLQTLRYLDETGQERTAKAVYFQDQERASKTGEIGFKTLSDSGDYFNPPKYIPAHKVLGFGGDGSFALKKENEARNKTASAPSTKENETGVMDDAKLGNVGESSGTGKAKYLRSYEDDYGKWWSEWQLFAKDGKTISNPQFKQSIKDLDVRERTFIHAAEVARRGSPSVRLAAALAGNSKFKGKERKKYAENKDGTQVDGTEAKGAVASDFADDFGRYKPLKDDDTTGKGLTRFGESKPLPSPVGPSAAEQARRDKFAESYQNNGNRAPTPVVGQPRNGAKGSRRIPKAWESGTNKKTGKTRQQFLQDKAQQNRDNFQAAKEQFMERMIDNHIDSPNMSDAQKNKWMIDNDPAYRRLPNNKARYMWLQSAKSQLGNYKQKVMDDYEDRNENAPLRYYALGGSINGGMDSVPAMLTPGEFVMSREAVARHGVGNMKNLNMGKATGFRSGGSVGSGGVQYKVTGGSVSEGGAAMIDMSQVSNAFQGFSEQMTTITGAMSGIADKLQGIAESFGSLTMFHTFAGELSMNVNISNKDAIIAAVSDGLLPMIANQIQAQIDASANTFNAGG